MTARVFIDGAVGTTGLEIAARLAQRDDFALITLPEAQRKDAQARSDALNNADFVILCLPDDAARQAVALIENPAVRVIDASSAHRTSPGWTFGFPEVIGRDAVAGAARLSNPGCYSTGFIALIAPLVRAGLIPADLPLHCNAVSGYSGGGKALIERFEVAEPDIAYRSYALTLAHKHVPEMQHHSGLAVAPLFAPAVIPGFRGMVVEVPPHLAALPGQPGPAQLHEALCAFYAGSRIVQVASQAPADGELLLHRQEAAHDDIALHIFASADGAQARLVAVLDNLGKGASGAAVQNLNLMAGLDETSGLRLGGLRLG